MLRTVMTIWLGCLFILPFARTQIQDIVWHSLPYHQFLDEHKNAELSFSIVTEAPFKDLNKFMVYFDTDLILLHEQSTSSIQFEPSLQSISENTIKFTCSIPYDKVKKGRSFMDIKISSKENGKNWYFHDFSDELPSLNAGKMGFRNAALHYEVNESYSLDYALLQNDWVLADFPDQLGGIFTNGFCKDEVISIRDLMVQVWVPSNDDDIELALHLLDEQNNISSTLALNFVKNGSEGEKLNPYFKNEPLLPIHGLSEKLYKLDIISDDVLAQFVNNPGEHTFSFYLSLTNADEHVRLPDTGNFNTQITIANAPVGADCQAALLPIELLDFLVIGQEDQVFLKWISALEINNQFYAVERSSDVLDWKTIYEVHGQGNSIDYLTYTFRDLQPLPGINYYRLKQMDFDGSLTYSKVKTVRIKSSSIQLHPNPVRDYLYYKIDDPKQKYELQVYNLQGDCLFERTVPDPSSQFHRIDFSSIPNGTYILKYINQENYLSRTAKFVKL